MARLRRQPQHVDHAAVASTSLQKRAPVQRGTSIELTRAFNSGQLVYSMPVTIEEQTLMVQIDTSSSDLWVASDRCNTNACRSTEGYEVVLFSDNNGLETRQNFQINYLVGSASGPIIVSNLTFADTEITDQAFASANAVLNEDLSQMNVSGVVGLGLPANSIIQTTLSGENPYNEETNTSETGSPLPGLWSGLPSDERFFAIGLQRLPSDGGNGNSTLTFGGFDTNYLPDSQMANLKYASVTPDSDNIARRWKMVVNDFQVYVNGTQLQIPLSATGVATPTAVIDSAAPLNLASANFLNALYGAVNVGPAADGSGGYYVDCGLALNLTITLGGNSIPMHPLDSNLKQDNTAGRSNGGCIGSFQQVTGATMSSTYFGSQIVLGAPFLRSVYSVYSCESTGAASNGSQAQQCPTPRVGLHALYNTSETWDAAMADFNKVRVQGLQLGDNSIVDGSSAAAATRSKFGTGAKIAIGVAVGLVCLLAAMAALLVVLKRRRSRLLPEESSDLMPSTDQKDPTTPGGGADLSEKERQKARELALLYGHYVEDADNQSSAMSSHTRPTFGSDSQTDWDVSSKGYWEARAIKHDYQKKLRQQQQQQFRGSSSTRNSVLEHDGEEPESHELVDLSNNVDPRPREGTAF